MKLINRYIKKPFVWRVHIIHAFKRFHIIAIFIFLSGISTAQNPGWFPTGSLFTYVHQNIDGPDYYQTSLEISEEVTLNGQPCVKMELMEDESPYLFSCMIKSPPFYVYEQNDSVFYATDDDQEFRLLYDFNAEIGDTWYIVADHAFGFDSLEVEVLESEMIEVEGNDLKQLTVSISPAESEDDVFIEPPFGPVRILEYVGALDFFFVIIGKNPACDATTSESLQCYTSEGLDYFANEAEACILTSASFESGPGTLTLFPNPATDRFIITLPNENLSNAELRLYDISGRLVFSELSYGADQMINMTAFSPGLYIVHLTTAEGSLSGKLLIE